MKVTVLIDILTTYLEREGDHEVVVDIDDAQYSVTDCMMDVGGENIEIYIN